MNENKPLKIVCIGGGTGLSTLLRGFKEYVKSHQDGVVDLSELTAIVSVSDDGGSSGRLIKEYDTLPPGDMRKCLLALADEDIEPLMSQFLDYRFNKGENELLAGHSAGNLILISLLQINKGDLKKSILDISNLLSIKGNILFPTLEPTTLYARLTNGSVVRGQSQIPMRQNLYPIESVFLSPRKLKKNIKSNFEPMEDSVEAIKRADVIILGPGSLYTSIIPNLLVGGISDAIKESKASKIYICNIMTEPGETDDYSVANHVEAIRKHGKFNIDLVIANKERIKKQYLRQYATEKLVREYEIIKKSLEDAIRNSHEDAVDTCKLVEDIDRHARRLEYLSRDIRKISDESIQVIFNPKKDNMGKSKLYEINAVEEVEIEEDGIKKRVIRHDAKKLVKVLIKLIGERNKTVYTSK